MVFKLKNLEHSKRADRGDYDGFNEQGRHCPQFAGRWRHPCEAGLPGGVNCREVARYGVNVVPVKTSQLYKHTQLSAPNKNKNIIIEFKVA